MNPESKLVILPKKRAEYNSGTLVRFGWTENELGQPPLIILGMHCSGTSVLAGLLEKLGLFTGYSRERDNKSTFFLRLNQWMLSETNASCDSPYWFRFLNDYPKVHILSLINRTLAGQSRIEFLGPDYTGKCADIRELDVPWGWKNP